MKTYDILSPTATRTRILELVIALLATPEFEGELRTELNCRLSDLAFHADDDAGVPQLDA